MATTRSSAEEKITQKEEAPLEHAPRDLKTSGDVVKHNPMELFSARVINRADWESIGVYDQPSVEWNEQNGFELPVEMFTDKALAYLKNQDDGFEVVKASKGR